MHVGDLVKVKRESESYIYVIKEQVNNGIDINNSYVITGIHYRISRVEKEDDLIKATSEDIEKADEEEKRLKQRIFKNGERTYRKKYLLGTILHIDGDEEYLKKCIELYDEIGIHSYGKCIKESEIFKEIGNYLLETNPDVVVITGHDIYNNKGKKDLNNYSNTNHFIKAVKEIRKIKGDGCVVIAGACQSNFEALIASGADFASSPNRINIHTFDPAIIAIKVATTSFNKIITDIDIFKYIDNGKEAFGGLQTYGKMRMLL